MRKPLAAFVVLMSVICAVVSVVQMERIPWRLGIRDDNTILGVMTVILIICFDYAYVVGFRSAVLGVSLSDVTYHFAGPFSKRFNLVMSFGYGIGSAFFFLWLIAANSPLLALWLDFKVHDMIMLLISAAAAMILIFLFTSYLSARFCDSLPGRLISVAVMLVINIIVACGAIGDMTKELGSFDRVKEQGATYILENIGNSRWAEAFPIAGWISLILKGAVRGDTSKVIPVVSGCAVFLIFTLILYMRTEFDFYERALDNAQKIADIVEASKAGVEAVNTGIARTAVVGKEELKRGWGASSFFHMHLFENKRTSKLFFLNKVALVYRVMALLFLLVADGFVPEDLDILIVVAGIATMMVLNAIVFGGGKTVMEFNRPYLFIVPERSIVKLAACILADIPEMVFDAFICTVIIKLVAWKDFTILPMFSFILMMICFDLLSETTGIVCVRLFRKLGKFALMAIRYVVILILIVAGMIPAAIVSNILTPMIGDRLDIILSVLVASMGLTYVTCWIVMIILSRNVIENADV